MVIAQTAIYLCPNCGTGSEASARFCSQCGCAKKYQLPNNPPVGAVPSFAQPKSANSAVITKELQEEAAKIIVLLARERLFLYFHWLTFIAINAFGFWIAMKCYLDYVGDEMTKLMIASTPFLYINLMTLLCLVPIKGTRLEISRLKERLSYVKFKLEYGHLL